MRLKQAKILENGLVHYVIFKDVMEYSIIYKPGSPSPVCTGVLREPVAGHHTAIAARIKHLMGVCEEWVRERAADEDAKVQAAVSCESESWFKMPDTPKQEAMKVLNLIQGYKVSIVTYAPYRIHWITSLTGEDAVLHNDAIMRRRWESATKFFNRFIRAAEKRCRAERVKKKKDAEEQEVLDELVDRARGIIP